MFRHSLRPYYLTGGPIALFLAITAAAGLLIQDIYQPFMSEGLVAAQLSRISTGFLGWSCILHEGVIPDRLMGNSSGVV